MAKLQVLITGATGFIGSHFIRSFSEKYTFKQVNLRNEQIDQLSMDNVDVVLHLAALVHQMNGAPAQQYFTINHNLTMKLARQAKAQKVPHFIYMSTAHVFGHYGNIDNPSKTLNEDSPCDPKDAYGQSKLLAEENLKRLSDDTFKVSLIRAPLVYGPGGKGNLNSLRNLIRIFPFLPFRYQVNKRSLVYVKNLVHFMSLVIDQKKPGLFLAQDKEPISIQQLVELISKSSGFEVVLFKLPKIFFRMLYKVRPYLIQRLFGSFALDSRKTNEVLGYSPIYSTEDGLLETFKN